MSEQQSAFGQASPKAETVSGSSDFSTKPSIASDTTLPHYTRRVATEDVNVPKHLLINVAAKLIKSQEQAPGPGSEWLIASATTFVATVFLLATSTFHSVFGQTPDALGGFALLVLALSAFGTIYFAQKIFRASRRSKASPMTADQWYEELCREMEAETRRIAALEGAARQDVQ